MFGDQTESWILSALNIHFAQHPSRTPRHGVKKRSSFFQVSKFITRLLRKSKQVNREEDGGVHYDQIIAECKKKLSDDTGYWSDEMMQQYANAPHWSLDTWISVLAKGGGQKQRFQYCVNPNYSQKFLYLGATQAHAGSTINPALQDNVLLPEGFTEYIYHVGNGKELRSMVNHGFDSRRSQSQNRQTCCVLHCCESDG